jgi:isoquinoline 1-oxidoreductase alpha subunit
MIEFRLNGQLVRLDVDPAMPLLWAIRERAGLTGTKFGCGIGACGACTLHVDGTATRSCVVPISGVAGRDVRTIEGLGGDGPLDAIQEAWIDAQVPQCGYCQSGMIMAVAALLAVNPAPTDAEIDESITNICRCGTYERIRSAIHAAAAQRRGASRA